MKIRKGVFYLFMTIIIIGCDKEGSIGKNSLISLEDEPKGPNCINGGYKLISGIDLNSNNIIDVTEIQNTKYICNGENGANSLMRVLPEPAGTNCSSGGFNIASGIDLNNNNILDANEIQNTEYICNGDDGNVYFDNLVRLVIPTNSTGTCSSTWFLSPYPTYNLPDFSKNDYANVDSIVFVPSLHSDNENNKCFIELYNITDGVSIGNSEVESASTSWDFHYSKNIYDDLPSKRINIGIRIRSENNGQCVSNGVVSYLYIYKH